MLTGENVIGTAEHAEVFSGGTKGKGFKNRRHQRAMGKELPFKSRQSNLQLIIKGTEAFYRVSRYSRSAAFPLTRGDINLSQTGPARTRPCVLGDPEFM